MLKVAVSMAQVSTLPAPCFPPAEAGWTSGRGASVLGFTDTEQDVGTEKSLHRPLGSSHRSSFSCPNHLDTLLLPWLVPKVALIPASRALSSPRASFPEASPDPCCSPQLPYPGDFSPRSAAALGGLTGKTWVGQSHFPPFHQGLPG